VTTPQTFFQDNYGQWLEVNNRVTFLYRKKRYYAKVKSIRVSTLVALLDVVDDSEKIRTLESNRQRTETVFTFPVQKLFEEKGSRDAEQSPTHRQEPLAPLKK
jgi:hypothetical protein